MESATSPPDSPRGNAIGRMVDAAEIAYLTAFLASDKAWAVTGELVVATGGAGRSVYYSGGGPRNGPPHPPSVGGVPAEPGRPSNLRGVWAL